MFQICFLASNSWGVWCLKYQKLFKTYFKWLTVHVLVCTHIKLPPKRQINILCEVAAEMATPAPAPEIAFLDYNSCYRPQLN